MIRFLAAAVLAPVVLATVVLATVVLAAVIGSAAQAATLDTVKARGVVKCGISTGIAGFSLADSQGNYAGIDVEICHALAAAVLGDAGKVKFEPLSPEQRFTALQSGEVDLLARNTTWSLTREAQLGLVFGPTIFYDGQGFMVSKKLGVKSAKELSGATICVQPGTTTELNLADYFRKNNLTLKTVVIESEDEIEGAFFAGRCDALTTDASGLAGVRITRASNPDDYMILPEIISKEPLAPAVRAGDDQWLDIIRWTVFALVDAEEHGLTRANVDEGLKSSDPTVQRLLGVTPGNGKALGLDERWAYRAIRQVGNYGEIFDRTVGANGPLKLARGLNELWSKGGLLYAPPLR
ncbi:amino acid ABC transporter substrate-binding protein [Aliidongia dinghuensis]|uniref:Amino acid ABC transporter substrate-binding protein n=2 Tax=Aliidongia dinghuensis TaxID=1867774 RepID=A0A8J2YNZ7_9PROT|nr:amino acid ABC transporter substrate-binding protein [Aliidongia dinghuensis]